MGDHPQIVMFIIRRVMPGIVFIMTVCAFIPTRIDVIRDDELLYITLPNMENRARLYLHSLRVDVALPIRDDLTWGSGAVWSPDGAAIAYTTNFTGEHEIFIMDVKTGRTRPITAGTFPTWSGDHLVYLREGAFHLYDLTTDESRLLYAGDFREQQADFSPDGQEVIFHIYYPFATAITALDVNTGAMRDIIQSVDTSLIMPAWSPDGASIAYARLDSHPADIYVVDATGRNPRRLTTFQENELTPRWSPDSTYIAFRAQRPQDDYRPHIFIIKADGSAPPRRITWGDGGYIQADWRP